jgi:hypothetical protein
VQQQVRAHRLRLDALNALDADSGDHAAARRRGGPGLPLGAARPTLRVCG